MNNSDKYYLNPVEAAKAWAPEAIKLTLRSNKEYSSYIIKTKRGYRLTKPRRGAHSSVVFAAILGCPMNLFKEISFIHTHTDCACHIPDKFSGDLNHPLKYPGDVSAVILLKYKSIFLVAPDGKIYEYADQGNIKTALDLRNLKPVAIIKNSDEK